MNSRFFLICILVIFASAACSPESTGTRAWIDSPLDGATVQVGAPVIVLSHVSAQEGVTDVLLSVNGIAYRRNPPTLTGDFAKSTHEWFPDKPGDYTLQIIAYSKSGEASAPATTRIHVIGKTTPTPTPVPRISVTPTRVPLSDLEIVSVEAVVTLVKGDTSLCDIRVVYRNAGTIPVPNDYVIQAYLDGRPFASMTRGRGFGVGGTSEATFAYQFVGTAYIGINLDSTNAVSETSEMNNAFAEARMCGRATTPITITPSPTPTIGLPGITPSPTPTRTPTSPPPVVPPPSINFRADQTTITRGQCTTLRWDIENATTIYLDGNGVPGHSTLEVCPNNSTTYTLRVIAPTSDTTRSVAITVQAPAYTPTPTNTPKPLDTQGPPAPTLISPKGTLSCRTSVTLDWNAVSDPSGIKNYIVKWTRNDGQTGGTVTTSTQATALVACGKSYTWSVQAVDNANNAGGTASANFTIQEGLY